MKKKDITILFDLDGTLIDSTDAILESFEVAFKCFKYKVPNNDLIKAEIGYPLEDMFKSLEANNDDIANLVLEYKNHYREINREKTYLLNGAKEAIIKASEFATLGVVTTKTAHFSILLLENMDIMQYFDTLIGREDVVNPKPHPEPIYTALKRLNIDSDNRDNIWMIGDTIMDIISAKEAGIKSIGLSCGYGFEKDLKQHTNIIKDSALNAVIYIKNCL